MRIRVLGRLKPLLLMLPLLVAGCDPQGPGAAGQIKLSPDINIGSGKTLEVRAFPDDGQTFDPETTDWSNRHWAQHQSWPLGEIKFPFDYLVGGKMGYTDDQRWRLLVWIAGSESGDRPSKGAWYSSRLFSLNKCGLMFSGYCGISFPVDITIDHRIEIPSPQSATCADCFSLVIQQQTLTIDPSTSANSVETAFRRIAPELMPSLATTERLQYDLQLFPDRAPMTLLFDFNESGALSRILLDAYEPEQALPIAQLISWLNQVAGPPETVASGAKVWRHGGWRFSHRQGGIGEDSVYSMDIER